jgi:hypothetical protein
MSGAHKVAIDEGTKQDLQWFMACAHVVNDTVSLFKCARPRIDIFVDASLSGLGGALNNHVYELPIVPRPDYCIAHWEAINVLVALRIFSPFLKGHNVKIWCDNQVAVSILSSARGMDPILQSIARNIWLVEDACDCTVSFSHIKGSLNKTADLLSRWVTKVNPVAELFQCLNDIPRWCVIPANILHLDPLI